jgi:hypothetical protein
MLNGSNDESPHHQHHGDHGDHGADDVEVTFFALVGPVLSDRDLADGVWPNCEGADWGGADTASFFASSVIRGASGRS